MSNFVNYRNRSISLPLGCKDLIDVLHRRADRGDEQIIERAAGARMTRNESVTGRVSEISNYVSMAFESQALMFTLGMSSPGEGLTINIARMDGKTVWAFLTFQTQSEEERAVRKFIARRGWRPPKDTPTPAHFSPEMPVQVIYDISPLPSEPSAVAALVADILRCGLKDESLVHFHYDEMSDTG